MAKSRNTKRDWKRQRQKGLLTGMETVLEALLGVGTAAIGAYLGVYFDRRWPEDSKPPPAPSTDQPEKKPRQKRGSAASVKANGSAQSKTTQSRSRPPETVAPQGKRYFYTINILTTMFLTVCYFLYVGNNALNEELLALAIITTIDITLNTYLLNPRLTFRIPFVCGATVAATTWVYMVYDAVLAGSRDWSYVFEPRNIGPLIAIGIAYALLASVVLMLRRTVTRV